MYQNLQWKGQCLDKEQLRCSQVRQGQPGRRWHLSWCLRATRGITLPCQHCAGLCLTPIMSWQVFTDEWINQRGPEVLALAMGSILVYVAFKVLLLKSCLDKSNGSFSLWGGKRFSFSFYSLLIAKEILQ